VTASGRQGHYDVVVVGGGVAGVAAAAAAARSGLRTALLELRPFVGGNATTGLCVHAYKSRLGKQHVFGLAQECIDRLMKVGGAVGHVPFGGFVHSVTPVDGELFRIMATELLAEAGVEIFYGVNVVGVEKDGARVTALQVAMKGGVRPLRASTLVDASGDADVAAFAGAPFRKGKEISGKMQPVSMLLHFHGVETERVAEAIAVSPPAMATRPDHPRPFPAYFNGSFSRWNRIVREQGIFPNEDRHVFFNTVWPNQLNVNTSAVTEVDGTDTLALSRATVQLTRQCARIGEFLKKNVPGFENSYYTPAAIPGVRETRTIEGLYQITDDDVHAGRKFADTVGQICFPVDIHDPKTGQATFHEIGDDGALDIPYRALVPRGLDNVLIAGRCISATSFAHGATRIMAPCLVSGEAAGVAAAQLTARGGTAAGLDVALLQKTLLERGVHLGEGRALSLGAAR
jgi:hypothetical protein